MKFLNAIVAVAYTLSATTSLAANSVGNAIAVIEAASVSGEAGNRTLVVGSDVFVGDLINTDEIGEAQLLFLDGTRMVVGANSSLVIDEFLFRSGATDNKFAVKALGGVFRFISGDSGDEGYSIVTPTGTIGVRGTAFDFTVTPEDTKLIVLEGEATLCDDDKDDKEDCQTVATPCAVLRTNEEEENVEEVTENRQQEIDEYFPYVTEQSELREDFQVSGHGCATGGLAKSTIAASSIPVGAIVVGGAVILGGVLIGILAKGKSNNNTNN